MTFDLPLCPQFGASRAPQPMSVGATSPQASDRPVPLLPAALLTGQGSPLCWPAGPSDGSDHDLQAAVGTTDRWMDVALVSTQWLLLLVAASALAASALVL